MLPHGSLVCYDWDNRVYVYSLRESRFEPRWYFTVWIPGCQTDRETICLWFTFSREEVRLGRKDGMNKEEECLRAKDSLIKASRSFVDRWWWMEKRKNWRSTCSRRRRQGGYRRYQCLSSRLTKIHSICFDVWDVPGALTGPPECLPSLGQSQWVDMSPLCLLQCEGESTRGHERFCSLWYFVSELEFEWLCLQYV